MASMFVTKCLSSECTGFYTDSISESILITCRDPKHKNGEKGYSSPQPQSTSPTGNDGGTFDGNFRIDKAQGKSKMVGFGKKPNQLYRQHRKRSRTSETQTWDIEQKS